MQHLLACHLRMHGGRLNVVQQLPLRMHRGCLNVVQQLPLRMHGGCLNVVQQLPLRMRSGILTEAAPATGATPIVVHPVGLTPFNCIKRLFVI